MIESRHCGTKLVTLNFIFRGHYNCVAQEWSITDDYEAANPGDSCTDFSYHWYEKWAYTKFEGYSLGYPEDNAVSGFKLTHYDTAT